MDLPYFGSAADVAAVEAQLAQGPHPSRPALLAALAWYLRERDTRRALALADEAQAEPTSATESPGVAARLGLVRAEAKRLFGDAQAARALADDALQRFDVIGDFVGLGDAQMVLATLARFGGDPATAGPCYDAARLSYERAGDTLRQQIVDLKHAVLDIFADAEAGYGRWGPLLASTAALQQPELDAIAGMALGQYFFEGRYDKSIEHHRRGYEAALQTGQVAAAITAGANLTAAFNGLHSFETALQWAERTLELARAAGWPQSIGAALNQMGFVLCQLGRDAAAADILHEAVATLAPFPNARNRVIACLYLGELLLRQKQDEEALRQLEEAEAVAQRLGQESMQLMAVGAQAQALSRLGRSAEAIAAADRCQAYVERAGGEQNFLWPVLLRLRAELARRHDLALPAGSTAPSAPIHYLEQELAHVESSSGSNVPDDLLSLLSRDYEAVGDLARALDYERRAAAARQITHDKKATDLATALQSRHETERAKADAQHQKSLAQAEAARADAEAAANRAKSTFLANMSHELRSPLNALLGFTRLLQRNPQLDAQAQDDLAIVLRSAEHLYALINQVLELSKIEAGRMGVVDSDIDLYALLDELGDMFAEGVRQKGLHLVVDNDPAVPRFIRIDAVKLRQVLINLLGNAVKFTAHGSIALQAAMSDGRLHVSVRDTGVGVAPDELKQLGGAFVQAQAGRRAAEGTGLGLAISQSFVQLMGGELRLTSTPGHGTTAQFDIPVVVASPTSTERAAPRRRVLGLAPGTAPRRILVADDREESRRLLVRLLAPLGFEVHEAADGLQALQECEQWRPHLALMDMRMPLMDGREATRRVKAAEHGKGIVVIALTASSFEEQRQEIMAAGCDDFMRKPFIEDALLDMVAHHLQVQFVYEELPPEPAADDTSLASLPAALRESLARALEKLDVAAIDRAIEAVRRQDAQAAGVLARLAKSFDYQRMRGLL